MEPLSVRRNRGYGVSRYEGTGRAEKTAGSGRPQPAGSARPADRLSETLRALVGRTDRTGQQLSQTRRTLQAGEAALTEAEDCLGRMEALARRAAEAPPADRDGLQAQLDRLIEEIERIARDGVRAGLFQEDGEGAAAPEVPADTLPEVLSGRQEGMQALPDWLLHGMAAPAPDRAALLSALGLNRTAGMSELLAALGALPPERSSAAGYLAGLYLGAAISGGLSTGGADLNRAVEGLNRLAELVAEGVSPDQAVELLTGGLFAGMDDFYAQFVNGTAPELERFLAGLLLSGAAAPLPSAAGLLAAGGQGELELLMALLSALEPSGSEQLMDGAGDGRAGENTYVGNTTAAPSPGAGGQWETRPLGPLLASGPDLSGAVYDPVQGRLRVTGCAELVLHGQGHGGLPGAPTPRGQGGAPDAPALWLGGGGAVTLRQADIALLETEAARARVGAAGENTLARVRLGDGADLLLEGGGLIRIGALHGGAGAALRLTGGAAVLSSPSAVPIVVDGPALLAVPEGTAVYDAQGRRLTPLDLVWKTLLPDWSRLTALAVDGRQHRLDLPLGERTEALRLWLSNDSQGFPAHTVVLQGRDQAGRLRVRYAYLRWDRRAGKFSELAMYPNPFAVTGGEEGADWRYEQQTQTLHILSDRVTALRGGVGTDGDRRPFSGRLALADGLGRIRLTLAGVECRVSAGRAFSLGRDNDVTLLLSGGSENIFESGPGCAGISLDSGTCVRIDRAEGPEGEPEGRLYAAGGPGGAGIGRDSGAGWKPAGPILICGGAVTAAGTGGGAGIGGAPGARAGDIRIRGGTVTARAAACAAAIGAGIQGACGDITISGSARLSGTRGGPHGDVGGCLFGCCGALHVSPAAELGGARLWDRKGLTLQMGETALTLPRLPLSAGALGLDGLSLSTRETAQAALAVLANSRRQAAWLRDACGAMYGQLARSGSGLYGGIVREERAAGALLRDALHSLTAAACNLQGSEQVGELLR